MNKKLLATTLLMTSLTALTACGNINKIDKDGNITTDEVIFPKIEKSTFKINGDQQGTWVNLENLNKIEKGMNKSQIYQLIGEPHFRESFFDVREWNYTFNFKNDDGSLKQCQYKITFDKRYNTANFYWAPEDCLNDKKIELNADVLFNFNQSILTEKGKEEIKKFADFIEYKQAEKYLINGFTDKIGSENYNLRLSKARAEAVKAELAKYTNAKLVAVGKGILDDNGQCSILKDTGERYKECLKPFRKVEIIAVDEEETAKPHYKKIVANVKSNEMIYSEIKK